MNPVRLLIVDDSPRDQLLLDCVIEELCVSTGLQLECEHVFTGPDALRSLESAHYDAMILDQKMPEMSGSEVMSVFRERFGARSDRPKVLAYSSCDLPEFRHQCLADGADAFMPKYMVAAELGLVLHEFGLIR
ncbi:MAG: response regulator [Panacagrimonas sp.]